MFGIQPKRSRSGYSYLSVRCTFAGLGFFLLLSEQFQMSGKPPFKSKKQTQIASCQSCEIVNIIIWITQLSPYEEQGPGMI